jgi:hypothetical protein
MDTSPALAQACAAVGAGASAGTRVSGPAPAGSSRWSLGRVLRSADCRFICALPLVLDIPKVRRRAPPALAACDQIVVSPLMASRSAKGTSRE